MSGNEFNHRLSTLFAERAEREYQIPSDQLDRVAALIHECAAFDQERAECLAWGQQVELTAAEVDRLSELFSFHPELLGIILNSNPPSREVIAHILEQVTENDLNDMSCDICEELGDRVDFLLAGDSEIDDLEDVCFALLAHLRARVEEESEAHADGNVFNDPKVEQLIDVVAGLREDGRKRVLAYAYRELQALVESEAGGPIGDMDGYGLLRDSLKPLPRSVFDLIARSDEGRLPATKVVEQLGLSGMRSLGQLERSLSATVQDLQGRGVSFGEAPLTVERSGQGKQLALSADALKAWRAFLHAEDAAKKSPTV